MSSLFYTAKKVLLRPYGLDEQNLAGVLQRALGKGIDFADIFLQYSQSESWGIDEGLIKKGAFTIDQGVGIRSISGEKTGFAYADDLCIAALNEAADYARHISTGGKTAKVQAWHRRRQLVPLYNPMNPLTTLTDAAKVRLLKKIDAEARRADPRVQQVKATLSGSYQVELILASDGDLVADIRPLVRLTVEVLVVDKNSREVGVFGGGARTGYELFLTDDLALFYAREAVRIALINLKAIPAPAGKMPVVLGCGWPAVMLHEAVGHGLEADFNRKLYSIYSGKIGEQVASPLVSVVDQGNFPGDRRGSMNFDDEGTPTQRTLLIEKGVLCNYMYDKLNAHLMGVKSTGNGRRSSYAQIPLPRMTNTFMLAGTYPPEEIIASVSQGLFAINFSGGQVDITSGEFVFSSSEAYLIEQGKITRPVKGATLIGNGPIALSMITMVGNDLCLDNGIGTCGKAGQNVPVGVGQPTIKISELIVGGTE